MEKFSYYFLVRAWNNYEYSERCIRSLLSQRGDFTILYVDDCSDYTRSQKQHIKNLLKGHQAMFNSERKYSLRNAYETIHTYVSKPRSIVVNVDGDDWLIGKNVLSVIDSVYKETGCELTYGNCVYWAPGASIHGKIATEVSSSINRRYSPDVEKNNAYRKNYFLPLHLRSWKASAFARIHKKSFLRTDGSWIRFCEDQAIFLPLLEMSGGNYQVIQEPLYSYNIQTNYSDSKKNQAGRLFDEVEILRQPAYMHI
jgi:glycosyltransferase involved in cell wall biosynthesis